MLLVVLLVQLLAGNLLVVDVGNAFWKAALVSPGRFDVLTNQQSKRKTFTGLSFAGETRSFGDEAVRDFLKRPLLTPANFRWLLGVSTTPTSSRLPPVAYPLALKNETVVFSDLELTAEEALAHLLDFAKLLVRESGKSSENLDLVLSVPAAATLSERQAHVRSGRIAGFRRVSLVSEIAAAAVQRGVDLAGSKASNETISDQLGLNLILNVGASHTEACVFEFTANTTISTAVRGCASSLTGGFLFDALLADSMEKKFFAKNPKLTGPLDAKAKLRLLRQAEAAKLQLSANKETVFSVESLFQDRDFRVNVKREEFENLIDSAVLQVVAVVETALTRAGVNAMDIKTREVIGGAWRIPKLHTALNTAFGIFGQRLNGEEAAVLGAAFLAASELPSVKLAAKVSLVDTTADRKYTVKIFPTEEGNDTYPVTAILADADSRLGLRRVVKVPAKAAFASGISATVDLLENDIVVETWKVAFNESLNSSMPVTTPLFETSEPEGQLVLKFELDSSGLVRLNTAELRSSIVADSTPTPSNSSTPGTAAVANTLLISRLREAWEDSQIADGRAKLEVARKRDSQVVARLGARNSLEGFVYERRAKLVDDQIVLRVTQTSEVTTLTQALEDAETWLYSSEGGEMASQVDFEHRLLDLRLNFTAIDRRASEYRAREGLGAFLKKAQTELQSGMEDLREKRPWVSAIAVEKLGKDVEKFEEEWKSLEGKQESLKDYEEPAFIVSEVKKKIGNLVREIRRLLKIPAPLPETAANTTNTTTNSTANTTSNTTANTTTNTTSNTTTNTGTDEL